MHHRCGVTLHTCQRIDRSHGAFQEAILEKDREEGSEKWGEEKGVGRRFFAPRVLVSSKLTFYEAGSREKLGVTRDGCTPVGVSGFGGVLKHRTKEAKKRNHVVFFFLLHGFANASIGRAVETRLNRIWITQKARVQHLTPAEEPHWTRGWGAKSLSAPCW